MRAALVACGKLPVTKNNSLKLFPWSSAEENKHIPLIHFHCRNVQQALGTVAGCISRRIGQKTILWCPLLSLSAMGAQFFSPLLAFSFCQSSCRVRISHQGRYPRRLSSTMNLLFALRSKPSLISAPPPPPTSAEMTCSVFRSSWNFCPAAYIDDPTFGQRTLLFCFLDPDLAIRTSAIFNFSSG